MLYIIKKNNLLQCFTLVEQGNNKLEKDKKQINHKKKKRNKKRCRPEYCRWARKGENTWATARLGSFPSAEQAL